MKLDELQLKIMRVLWSRQEATVLEIRDSLLETKELAVTTISTVLSRLEKRNIVSHRKEGKRYVYMPEVREKDIKQSMVSTLVDKFFNGDNISLVNYLVNETDIDQEEIKALKDKINSMK